MATTEVIIEEEITGVAMIGTEAPDLEAEEEEATRAIRKAMAAARGTREAATRTETMAAGVEVEVVLSGRAEIATTTTMEAMVAVSRAGAEVATITTSEEAVVTVAHSPALANAAQI